MDQLRGKHLLLDTNLLIAISRYYSFGFFDDFLFDLESLKIRSVVDEATLFEFKRGSRRQSDLDKKNLFISALLGGRKNQMILQSSTSKDILVMAQELAVLYSHKQPNLSKQISFVDCLIAAQLMMYKGSLFLATMDNDDYPLFIFDRIHVVTIDTEKEILNVGIYGFNEKKYKKCRLDFGRAS